MLLPPRRRYSQGGTAKRALFTVSRKFSNTAGLHATQVCVSTYEGRYAASGAAPALVAGR